MRPHRTLHALAVLALLGLLPALGCRSQADKEARPAEERGESPPPGVGQGNDEAPSASEAAESVKDAAKDAAAKAEEAAGSVKDAAKDAAAKAEEAAEGLAPKVDAAKQLADVKMALMADPSVDGTAIDVDADEATKTIHLSGTVPTAAQKTAAERIAREKAQGYKVHNMLTVRAR